MYASVDVGSNSLRMLVGDIIDNRVIPHHHFRHVPRLGAGINSKDELDSESMDRALLVLQDFANTLSTLQVTKVKAVGTQALRRASNGVDFCRLAEVKTGIKIDILSGKEEAELSALGALSILRDQSSERILIDIGGGSTEIVYLKENCFQSSYSYPLGAVSLMEDANNLADIPNVIAPILKKISSDHSNLSYDFLFTGTAGTITTIAAYDLKMKEYDWRLINNYVLSLQRLREIFEEIAPLSSTERESLHGIEAGRGDIIIYGIAILIALMDLFQKEEVVVSDFGLLEGVLLTLNSV